MLNLSVKDHLKRVIYRVESTPLNTNNIQQKLNIVPFMKEGFIVGMMF